ncbi:USP domain-containing protein [Plasmodiophora brassicae]
MVAERETRRQRRRREVAQADDADAGDGVAHDAKRIRMDDDGDHGKGEAPASNGGVDEAVGAERPELDGTERAELDDDEEYKVVADRARVPESCPYLDTINRRLLDFDFEKLCSVSLSTHNVYGCLVCGKYFQGRGPSSHAYTHALHQNHHVFINLSTAKFYCLPDGYEVHDPSLEDIQFNLFPRTTPDQLHVLDTNPRFSQVLDGVDYLPGVIGLNNIKHTDWLNAILQALMRVRPLRDYFVVAENYASCKSQLVQRFGELVRKFWNPRLFRSHVSPHELLQAISSASRKQFRIGTLADPIKFLTWFLNTVHRELAELSPDRKSSIITDIFQGDVEVVTSGIPNPPPPKTIPFLYLSLDLPPVPLFKDRESDREVIPQVPLFILLQKFDGSTIHNLPNGEMRKHTIRRLPRYLILHFKRFTRNNFFMEKNTTIVNFPVTNLEMKDYYSPKGTADMDVSTRYNLVASVCHEPEQTVTGDTAAATANMKESSGRYRAHIWSCSNRQWYDIQDLHVQETMPQLVALSESYIQIWERNDS